MRVEFFSVIVELVRGETAHARLQTIGAVQTPPAAGHDVLLSVARFGEGRCAVDLGPVKARGTQSAATAFSPALTFSLARTKFLPPFCRRFLRRSHTNIAATAWSKRRLHGTWGRVGSYGYLLSARSTHTLSPWGGMVFLFDIRARISMKLDLRTGQIIGSYKSIFRA